MKLLLSLVVGVLLGGAAMYVLRGDAEVGTPLPERVTVYPTPIETAPAPLIPDLDTTGKKCSGASMEGQLVEGHSDVVRNASGLPTRVATMRLSIMEAALECDYAELERLALSGREFFSYSFGEEKGPASFWRARDREALRLGQPTSEYTRYLVQILALPHCVEDTHDGTTYVWPRVHCSDRRPSDWNDLEGLYTYTDAQIAQMRASGTYYGFRVGIIDDGDWVYFIAGD